MRDGNTVADHWGKGDVYGLILSAAEKAGKAANALTAEVCVPKTQVRTYWWCSPPTSA